MVNALAGTQTAGAAERVDGVPGTDDDEAATHLEDLHVGAVQLRKNLRGHDFGGRPDAELTVHEIEHAIDERAGSD